MLTLRHSKNLFNFFHNLSEYIKNIMNHQIMFSGLLEFIYHFCLVKTHSQVADLKTSLQTILLKCPDLKETSKNLAKI
ncbi:hypothetical protein BpHYR1_028367 [Brachionus plicatilis]|uniref:Uncharacterized protein n=1 Tax=Brachionus plicatilis TaxID=10195 RepID=A0A3M7T654_BRAPC|nr:hypothetical protein BpHYR1_028367 [Brachionus plicatilis]